jgi:SRSO17 transposase
VDLDQPEDAAVVRRACPLIFADTGFARQGTSSVAVARQYPGTPGKVGNVLVPVNCHDAERTIASHVAPRPYLPRAWADGAARLPNPRGPKGTAFQTKRSVAAVRHGFGVALRGDGPAPSAGAVLAAPGRQWRTTRRREGCNGRLKAGFTASRRSG